MKHQVVRELSTIELRERLVEEKKQFLKLKMNHAVSPLENPMKIKDYQKTIARMNTELRNRVIHGEPNIVEESTKKNNKK
ncbi:MAG: 50S ribosomal protein L29 [Bacteroidota bacterium]